MQDALMQQIYVDSRNITHLVCVKYRQRSPLWYYRANQHLGKAMILSLFATCPKNLESLLEEELRALGATDTKQTIAGVYFSGTLETGYRVCLWSRLANRILLQLGTIAAEGADDIYAAIKSIDWSAHFSPSQTIRVDFTGMTDSVRHLHFGALKVKDAIVDQFREKTGERPSIDKENPDIRINVRQRKTEIIVSLDLSGESLHRRGYRSEIGAAPLKENLACALLYRANWPARAKNGEPLLDPLCGVGTLIVEAGLMAADIAPGLLRKSFGFLRWRGHDASAWEHIKNEAFDRKNEGLRNTLTKIVGCDANPSAISAARVHIERAGLENMVSAKVAELMTLTKPHELQKPGLIVTNPPYGERLSDAATLVFLYQHLGDRLKAEFLGWDAAIITSNPELGKNIGLRPNKNYAFFNGAIPCQLLLMSINPDSFFRKAVHTTEEKVDADIQVFSSGAQMFANRLIKNNRNLNNWRKKTGVTCYRLYDADLPEYSVAIDIYANWAHVQEYAAPKTIDPDKAEMRLKEILEVIPAVLSVPANHIILKQRTRQKGKSQYEKHDARHEFLTVEENGAKYRVNLRDYLDTGLFLDNRLLRAHIQSLAKDKRFLNLFCYTATATVAAGLGGAKNSVSVDLSKTYLDWARQNFALNGMSTSLHYLVHDDCLEWLKDNQKTFDLILLDPPTFSNSKRMDDVLDVQRDHVWLINKTMQHLSKNGVLIFCTNARKFKLEAEMLAEYAIKNISAQTIDMDFKRNPNIHQCWEIRFQ
jgi:23S rRNA (guanine2445-N2)-methyltransferase / 23S rRNA (guanine2069-N7)-methyltransferase